MNSNSVAKKLGVFKSVGNNGAVYYYSRTKPTGTDRQVKVVQQENGNCIALPLFVEESGEERVVFHAKTIKSLVQFLQGE